MIMSMKMKGIYSACNFRFSQHYSHHHSILLKSTLCNNLLNVLLKGMMLMTSIISAIDKIPVSLNPQIVNVINIH